MRNNLLKMLIAAMLVLSMAFAFASCVDKDKGGASDETPGESGAGPEGDDQLPDDNNGDNEVDASELFGW
jgi:hypothetical protein